MTASENSSDVSDVDLLQPERSFDEIQPSKVAAGSNNSPEVEDWERLAFESITSNVYWTYTRSLGYFITLGGIFSLIFMLGAWEFCLISSRCLFTI